jgi:hypothetical protein
LVEVITPRYRAAEVLGLRPEDVDLAAGVVTVRSNRVEMLATRDTFGAESKSDAEKRE